MNTSSNESMIKMLNRKGTLTDERVAEAIRNIPREYFLSGHPVSKVYSDIPLPTEKGQTISQPSVVSVMTELLNPQHGDRILEIGTGSGWQSAILSYLVGEKGQIYSIERIESLAEKARENLEKAGIEGVNVFAGDGSTGLREYAPYRRIICTAAAPEVADEWFEQLEDSGRIVVPVGDFLSQTMIVMEKRGAKRQIVKKEPGYRFVPLRGKKGQ